MVKHKLSIADQIRHGERSQGSELIESDIGNLLSPTEGFGRCLSIDIGKKVWVKSYGLVMENNEQCDKRKSSVK